MSVVNTYKVYENQSWLDVSIALYGSVIFSFELAILNNSSPSEALKAGQEIIYNDNEKDVLVLKSLYGRNSIPATGLTPAQKELIPQPKGIGIMKISNSFKVG
ncbi:hypothetical protein AB670_02751 [Chryseobacterium sp. MOF25P]|uniref:hypothetical protein n=1 Tax=unclassified Chryseobacterium TaxID=2593645 RepID=UPI000805960F|nr:MULTISPECIES: hypothetical protein [unclassified Chryseobacterium]OBW40800.1 hypothetical protein AB670_02751 [Chryseobacterium sp. MOF25P]OBW45264.1 hypothetical protein AB671_02561 [Chryseobacterium sp. BGARF1]